MPPSAEQLRKRIREIREGHECLIRSVFGNHQVPGKGQSYWARLVKCVHELKKDRDRLWTQLQGLRAIHERMHTLRREMNDALRHLGVNPPIDADPWVLLQDRLCGHREGSE